MKTNSLNADIICASSQLMDGLISVTEFCTFCALHGLSVSEIHTSKKEIVFCFDTGRVDSKLIPITQFTTLKVN